MNTAKSFAVAVALCTAGASVLRADGPTTAALAVGASSLGQAAKSKADARREADELLKKAREAMQQGHWETADSLISRAEALKVDYNLFHVGDTPKKARRDLEKQMPARSKSPERPSQRFSPTESPASDEAARPETASLATAPAARLTRPAVVDPADDEGALPAPNRSVADEGRSPFGRRPRDLPDERPPQQLPALEGATPIVGRGGDDAQRRRSDEILLAAHKALAVGDVRRAAALVEQASALGVSYGPGEDGPQRVGALVERYRDVIEQGQNRQNSDGWRRQYAQLMMDQAQQLLARREFDEADRLASEALKLRVSYGAYEARPEQLLQKIAAARRAGGGGEVRRAGGPDAEIVRPAPTPGGAAAGGKSASGPRYPTTQAVFDPQHDVTRNVIANARLQVPEDDEPAPASPGTLRPLPPVGSDEPADANVSEGMRLFLQGQAALRNSDKETALECFRRAYGLREQLDPGTVQRLQGHLQLLSPPAARSGGPRETLLEGTANRERLAAMQLSNDVSRQVTAAQKVIEKDPQQALAMLKQTRATVEAAQVDPPAKTALLKSVDHHLAEVDKYIHDHRAQIELDEQNRQVIKEVDRRRNAKVEVDEKLAKLVNEYNQLRDEQRFEEAELVAKRAKELAPDEPITAQLLSESRFIRATKIGRQISRDKEGAVLASFESVEESSIGFDDRKPLQFGDVKSWADIKSRRAKYLAKRERLTEKELEIQRKLKTPVSVKYQERPLEEVIQSLGQLAGVAVHLDPQGLTREAVEPSTPVTIDLSQDISLKSALNLILEPLHLSYIIKDEVLKITSEQSHAGEVYTETYPVGDLVTPIPNFVPNSRMGLTGALQDAHAALSGGAGGGFPYAAPAAVVASRDGRAGSGVVDPQVLAQMQHFGGLGAPRSGVPQPIGFGPAGGPGGAGGGTEADFDSLIDLIVNTVQPDSWDENGGKGTISPFATNLSLVVSQTQEVHEQIADLLEQLRRLQDLQVTIEVRFITLNDNFFERIGVDFDFNIEDHNNATRASLAGVDSFNPSRTVGMTNATATNPFPNFTADLDLPFRQSSFDLAIPQFGQPVDVATFGFAILSDIEAFFLIAAAQGDRRSNVLQAPKVTMFNGQQAFVSDTSQTPFVVSVIPVVGDFAAAQQPVIVVLSEGTFLTVQAVVSNDRRFVRLTVVPFFSQIGKVDTFTFSGSKTTTKNSSSSGSSGNGGDDTSTSKTDNATETVEGVTVQLPTFSFVSVTTTVSVPDGGTVLLGGIKRLSEGRNEFGVPILSKLPYINRLFKNVGIGRETQSLMMMVTPRIIIQEEEEERLGVAPQP